MNLAKNMINHGADVSVKDGSGWSPFDEAITQKNTEFSVFLFEELRKIKLKRWVGSRLRIIKKL